MSGKNHHNQGIHDIPYFKRRPAERKRRDESQRDGVSLPATVKKLNQHISSAVT